MTCAISRRDCAARGIHLVLMPAPNKESIYPERLSGRAGPAEAAVARQTRQLFERLRAAHVEVVDLFDVFHQAKHEQAATGARTLYLAQDTHWSPAGVALAAKAAAERLLARDRDSSRRSAWSCGSSSNATSASPPKGGRWFRSPTQGRRVIRPGEKAARP